MVGCMMWSGARVTWDGREDYTSLFKVTTTNFKTSFYSIIGLGIFGTLGVLCRHEGLCEGRGENECKGRVSPTEHIRTSS